MEPGQSGEDDAESREFSRTEYLYAAFAVLLYELRRSETLSEVALDRILRSLAAFTRDRPDKPATREIHRDLEYMVAQMLDLPPPRGSRQRKPAPPAQRSPQTHSPPTTPDPAAG
jgi:hypothetical protein